jgi:hypothetical protein
MYMDTITIAGKFALAATVGNIREASRVLFISVVDLTLLCETLRRLGMIAPFGNFDITRGVVEACILA